MNKTPYFFLVLILSFLTLVDATGQVNVRFSDASGNMGEDVVVNVTVDGFTNVRNFNFLMQWNSDLLEYVSVDNVNPLFPSSEIDFGTPDLTGKPDRLTTALIQPGTPVEYSLSSSDVLFSVTLRIISPLCTSTNVDTLDILPRNEFVLFNNGVETKIKPGSIPGEVDINPGCAASNVLSLGDVSGLPGTEVCIPFLGTGLTDLGGFNGLRLNWDPSVMTYTRVDNKTGPQGTPIVNDNNAATGQLEMIYSYVGPGGIGLTSDSTVLFCLCFQVVGDCDASIPLTLAEAANFGIFDSSNQPINSDLKNGSFMVNCCDANASITDVSCPGSADGAIDLTTTGCMNVTSIIWSNTTQTGGSINNLIAGSYDATITYDGGASSRVLTGFTVREPAAITMDDIVFTKVENGNDGGINVSVVGGTMPYDYNWSNGSSTEDLTNIAAGDYSLTITDDNNCTAIFGPYTVATAPSIAGVVNNVVCFGSASGSIDISVSGGAQPYTYNWSCSGNVDPGTGDIAGLTGGQCTVTVTDANDCASTQTFTVNAPSSAITATAAITDDVTNDGSGAIALTVGGGWGDYQYNWDDGTGMTYPSTSGLNGLFGGSYSVTITDANGCSAAFGPYAVSGLRVFANSISVVQCFGDNSGAIDIDVLGGSGTYTYDWSCSGNVDTNGDISGLTAGTCTVTVTDVAANSSTVGTFQIAGPSEELTVQVEMTCATQNDGALTATVNGGVAPYSYAWNTNPAQSTAIATGLDAGEYSVLVSDSLGCQVMGLMSVRPCDQTDCFTAMDVITPNEDGKNDFFIIDCALETDNKLRIFTRWGQEVIEFNNYQNNWDGYDEGRNLVDEDTYMWVLEVYPPNGNTELYKGAVSVIYRLR